MSKTPETDAVEKHCEELVRAYHTDRMRVGDDRELAKVMVQVTRDLLAVSRGLERKVAPRPEGGTLLNQVAAVRASIDGHVKAQRMGGDDRWAHGYNEGLLKLAYIMKRDLSEIEKHGL